MTPCIGQNIQYSEQRSDNSWFLQQVPEPEPKSAAVAWQEMFCLAEQQQKQHSRPGRIQHALLTSNCAWVLQLLLTASIFGVT